MPMLTARRRSISGTEPDSPNQRNKAGVRHDRRSTTAAVPFGSTRGRLSVMPPPVMCAMPLTSPRAEQRFDHREVRPVRAQQGFADRLAKVGNVTVDGELQPIEHDLPGQRVAVGVQPRGRQSEQHIADGDALAVDQMRHAPPRRR